MPQQDAIVVQRLSGAGASIVGKTNTPEFGWMGMTDNFIFGKTRNPWNLEVTPGGSSGGAAAAVAAAMGSLAIGSDGGGSIRVPGSFCGVFGFKPGTRLLQLCKCQTGGGHAGQNGRVGRQN